MQLVLDGIEDRPYKPAHEVRLFGAVPFGPLAQLVRASGSCLNKLEGNREGNLTYQEGNELVYGEPADREFEPHFKCQTGRS